MEKVYLTTHEVSALFRAAGLPCSRNTLARWAKTGSLVPIRPGGTGHMRYRAADVERFIEAGRVEIQ